MRQLFLFVFLAALLASCGKSGYRYTKTGLKYKIIDGGGKDSLKHGDLIKVFFESRYEDSVLNTSNEMGYQLFAYDSNMAKMSPYSVAELLPMMKVGDSAIGILRSDSVIVKQFGENPPPGAVPDFIKKGKHFYMLLKIVQKYTDTAQFNADRKKEFDKFQAYQNRMTEKMMAQQREKDSLGFAKADAEFEKFIAPKKSSLVKTAGGSYVEILEPGTGAPCDSGKMAQIRYRGTLLDGKEFDTNMPKAGDTLKKEPFNLIVGQGMAIPGFDEAVSKLRAGARAKVYIPAKQGYGNAAQGPVIKPYSNLAFELVIETVNAAPRPVADVQQQANPNYDPSRGGNTPPPAGDHSGHHH